MGSFLPADSGALKQWTESTVEDALTKNMYFKTLNAVMKAQKHFISCTTDLQYKPHTNRLIDKKTRKVNACFSDNTGPENLRGCIPASPATNGKETVCYLYRWADRGIVISHHIEEPWGWQQLASFDAVPADIIKSSYLSRRYSLGDEQYDLLTDPASLARGPSAEFITDPTTPGMFSIPVCNTPYNWNGHTNGYSYWDDMNPWSARKSLPCYCGVLGNETQSVWSSMRLDVSEKRGEYLTMLCPRQISDKIENRLERWIAKCRLRVSKILLTHHQRFDHFCDIVIDEIEARGIISADEFYPELTHVIMCKARGSRNKTCKKYSHTPMDMAWLEAEALREKNRRKGSNGMAEIEQSQREFDAEDEEALRELETKEGMDVTIEQLELEEPVEPKSSSSSRLPKPTEAALVKPYAHMGKERPKPTPVTASASETPTVPATTTVTKAYKNHKDYKLDDF